MNLLSRLSEVFKQKMVSNVLQPLLNRRRVPRGGTRVRGYKGFRFDKDKSTVALECANADISLHCLTPGIWRVMVNGPAAASGVTDPFPKKDYLTWSIELTGSDELTVQKQDENTLFIQNRKGGKDEPGLEALFHTGTATLEFRLGGRLLHREPRAPFFRRHWVGCEKQAPEGEYYCGFGEKTGGLFKNGQRLSMWNTDNSDLGPRSDPMWQSCPLQICIRRDGFSHALFFDNPHFSRFILPAGSGLRKAPRKGPHQAKHQAPGKTPRPAFYAAEEGPLCYYVIAGPGLKEVLRNFTLLCGRYPLPPRWVLGHHHSRWEENESAARLLSIARGFREHGIPCDTLHIDIGHMNGYRSFTWNRERFPDPTAAIKALHEKRFKVVIMSDPGLKADPQWEVYARGVSRGFFCTRQDGSVFHAPVWPGDAAFPDYTSEQVREWWGSLYQEYVKHGIDGFWIDMNEPSLFTPLRTMPGDVMHASQKPQGPLPHRTVHNCYGLLMARATSRGLARLRGGLRNFLFTRSAFAGIQRYASSWTGDNKSKWSHLRMSVPMLLNMGLSGQVLVGPDIGGFWGKPTPELFLRWMQLGAFYPFCRNHSSHATPPRELWCFPERIQRLCTEALKLRYRLLPYFYTSLRQACEEGLPLMRPLFLEFPDDPACLQEETAAGQFMIGPDLMVCPVLTAGAARRRVYLPAGSDWLAWPGSAPYQGGTGITVETPPDKIPLFVRTGAVIPVCVPGEVTEEALKQTPILQVYPAERIRGHWYIDDGQTLKYLDGDFSLLRIEGQSGRGKLSLSITRIAGRLKPELSAFKEVCLRIYTKTLRAPLKKITVQGRSPAPGSRQDSDNWCELTLKKHVLPLRLELFF